MTSDDDADTHAIGAYRIPWKALKAITMDLGLQWNWSCRLVEKFLYTLSISVDSWLDFRGGLSILDMWCISILFLMIQICTNKKSRVQFRGGAPWESHYFILGINLIQSLLPSFLPSFVLLFPFLPCFHPSTIPSFFLRTVFDSIPYFLHVQFLFLLLQIFKIT